MTKVPPFPDIFQHIYGIFGYDYRSKLKRVWPRAQALYMTMCTVKSLALSLAWVWPKQTDSPLPPPNRLEDTGISKI